jgi:predicted MFS family arabinose efflux permease
MLNPVAPFRIALRERDLRLLLGGLATSQAGDWLYNLALLAFVYERTHSSMWVGLTTAVRIVPEVALGSLGGVLADRVDRRALMLGSDAVRALTMVALALVALTDAPVVLAPLLAALSTAAGSAYPPCVVAILPRLVADEQLPAANAARVSVTFTCIVAGPVFGAVLLLLGSPALAFAVNGATFAVGGLVVSALPRDAFRRDEAASDEYVGLVRELQTGWSALRGYRDGVTVVGANVIASAVYGAMTVLLVLLAQRAGAGTAGYGYLLAAAGVGAVVSAGLAQRAASGDRARRTLSISLVAVGAPLPLVAISGSLPAAAVLVAVIGAGSIVTEVVGDTCLQRALDPAVFARAYGLVVPAYVAAIAVGALLAPVFVDAFGLTATFVGLGFAVVAYGGFIAAGGKVRSARLAPGARPAGAAAAMALVDARGQV